MSCLSVWRRVAAPLRFHGRVSRLVLLRCAFLYRREMEMGMGLSCDSVGEGYMVSGWMGSCFRFFFVACVEMHCILSHPIPSRYMCVGRQAGGSALQHVKHHSRRRRGAQSQPSYSYNLYTSEAGEKCPCSRHRAL
jgi:hypothetical protein